jgi:hypothetical protein
MIDDILHAEVYALEKNDGVYNVLQQQILDIPASQFEYDLYYLRDHNCIPRLNSKQIFTL